MQIGRITFIALPYGDQPRNIVKRVLVAILDYTLLRCNVLLSSTSRWLMFIGTYSTYVRRKHALSNPRIPSCCHVRPHPGVRMQYGHIFWIMHFAVSPFIQISSNAERLVPRVSSTGCTYSTLPIFQIGSGAIGTLSSCHRWPIESNATTDCNTLGTKKRTILYRVLNFLNFLISVRLGKEKITTTSKKKFHCILAVLTYNAQTWLLTYSQKFQFGVCQRDIERYLGSKTV